MAVTQTYTVFLPGLYVKVSALNIHKKQLINALKRGKNKNNATSNYITKVNTGSAYTGRKQGKFFISAVISSVQTQHGPL